MVFVASRRPLVWECRRAPGGGEEASAPAGKWTKGGSPSTSAKGGGKAAAKVKKGGKR